jgi:predicted DNA-binding protein (MmcQ/YjbR family)
MTVTTHKALEDYILAKPGAVLTYPFGESVAVYKVADKMFALIEEKKSPVNISLKCDPKLAEVLRERYDEVQAGYHLNKKHWNTIVATGQLSEQEIFDLINHSYDLVVAGLTEAEQSTLKAS